jgi:hypothetical protein
MSNVIDFLERMGTDAHLRHASGDKLEQALIGAQIDPAVREALLMRDQRRLEELLGATTNVCCAIYAPAREDDDEGEEEECPDDGGDDEEEKAVRLSAG